MNLIPSLGIVCVLFSCSRKALDLFFFLIRSLQAVTLPLKPGSCKSLELDKINAVMPVAQQVISEEKKAVEIR